MANLLKESFAIESLADFAAGKWTSGIPNAVGTSYGRLGGYGANIAGGGLRYNIPGNPATLYFGCAFEFLGQGQTVDLVDASNNLQVRLAYTTSTSLLQIISYDGSTVLASTTLSASVWNYIEIEYVLATSATGSITVKLNGGSLWTLTSVKTSNTVAAAGALQIYVGRIGDSMNIADVYVNDSTGSSNNGFMGDVKQLTGRPNGAGLDTQWAIGGTSPAATNWQSVNDPQPNYDVTYVDDLTPGDVDLYAMSVPAGLQTFESLTVYAMVRKDDAGTRQVAACISNGTTVFVGPTYTINTTYSYIQATFDTNPFTSAPWAVVDASTLQVGIKVIS